MSELSQKLHYSKLGTTDEIKLYSTLDEVPEKYMKLTVDGINCYAGLANDGDVSQMIYRDSSGDYKALKSYTPSSVTVWLCALRNNETTMQWFPKDSFTVGDTFYMNNENAPTISGYDFVMAIPNNFIVTKQCTVNVYYIPQSIPDREQTNWGTFVGEAVGDLSNSDYINTFSGTVFTSLFELCTDLTKAPKLNTSNAITMQRMFQDCTALQSIFPIDTKNNSSFTAMFQNCSELDFTTNGANTFDLTYALAISNMFSGCTKITADKPIHLKNVPTSLNLSLIGTKHYIVDNYI